MNSIKIGTLVVASMFALNSFAQTEKPKVRPANVEKQAPEKKEKMTPEQKATAQTDRLAKKLALTEDQKSKIYDINLKVNNKNKVVREDKASTKEFKKESLEGNKKSREYLIREILTAEQKVTWDKIQAEKAAKKAEKKKHHEGHDHDGHSH